MKNYATIIDWCEIDGESTATSERNGEEIRLTRDKGDDIIVQELRDLNDEDKDADGPGSGYYWELIGISHTKRTTIVEWCSGRGHHATTQICWGPKEQL